MEGERGEIFRSAFPRLQRLCAARGLFLVFVDLRWGISEEEAKAGQVLVSCLRELERSQYFVSFLKRRYGWHAAAGQPDALIARTFEVAAEQYPFILRYRDRSITECEVIAAALDRRAPTHKAEGACLFYFASGRLVAGEPPETDLAERRMAELKAAIRAGRAGAVRPEYGDPYASALASAIHDDLEAMIERDYPAREARSWLEEERMAQEAHAHALRKVYVRRRAAHRALDAHAAAAGPELLLLAAPSGFGKSVLLANWGAEYEAAHEGDDALVVLSHFVGGSDGSAAVRTLVRRLHDELRERLFPFAPPALRSLDAIADETDLAARFAEWLAAAPAAAQHAAAAHAARHRAVKAHWRATSVAAVSQARQPPAAPGAGARGNPRARAMRTRAAESRARLAPAAMAAWRPRIVLVLDGIDQIAGTHAAARRLGWLPLAAGPDLRLVLSAAPAGDAYEAAKARPHAELPLGPLGGEEMEELARADLRTVGKALDGAQMALVLASGQCALPLFLHAVLGELKASANFETLTGLLETCLACRSAEQLYQITIARWLRSYPAAAPALRAVLCALAVSRAGLAEDELQALVGLGGHAAAAAAAGGDFLEPVSPLLWSEAFSAVLPALANRGGLLSFAQRPLALAVDQVFALGEAEGRRPHHARLARFFARQPAGDRRALELPHQLAQAGLLAELPAVLLDLDLLHRRRHDVHELAQLWRACGVPEGEIHARYEEALTRWEDEQRAALKVEEAALPPDLAPAARHTRHVHLQLVKSSRLAALLQIVGSLLRALGAFSRAAHFFRRSLATLEEMDAELPAGAGSAASTPAASPSPSPRGGPSPSPAPEAAPPAEADESPVIAFNFDERISHATHNLAALLQDLGRYEAALPLYERCLALDAKLAGYPHWRWRDDEGAAGADVRLGADAIATMVNLGEAYRQLHQFEEARQLLERALGVTERELGAGHPSSAAALQGLASVHSDFGDHPEALRLHERAVKIFTTAFGSSHPNITPALNNQAIAFQRVGEPAKAEALLRRCLAIREAADGPDHPAVAAFLNNLGEVLRAQGKRPEALSLFRRALRIRELAFGPTHHAVSVVLNNIASALQEEGDLTQALALLRRSLAIRRLACGDRHGTVAVACNNVGEVLFALGRLEEAAPLYGEALEVAEEAYGAGARGDGGPKTPRTRSGRLRRRRSSAAARAASSTPTRSGHSEGGQREGGGEAPPSAELGSIAANAAKCAAAMGRYADALPLFERAIAILERVHGPLDAAVGALHATTASAIAKLKQPGSRPAAVRHYRLALRAMAAAGGGPREAARARVAANNLALLYLATPPAEFEADPALDPPGAGPVQAAVPLLRRALAAAEADVGAGHADTAEAAGVLAGALDEAGERPDAAAVRARYGLPEPDEGGEGEEGEGEEEGEEQAEEGEAPAAES